MKTEETTKRVARIHEGVGGWYVSNDAASSLDQSGRAYKSVSAALANLRDDPSQSYSHYKTGKREVKL